MVASSARLYGQLRKVIEVPAPDEFFEVNEYRDVMNTRKPVVLVSAYDIYHTHALIGEHLDDVVSAGLRG